MSLESLRKAVCDLHALLPANELVAWTSGNISARDPETNTLLIKPSGLGFDELTPESMVQTDLEANVLAGSYKPSSDTATHAYIYHHTPKVGGIVLSHAQPLRDGVCGCGQRDSLLFNGDGRRVRRANSARRFRTHRG